jgi:hypothetical protein
VRVRDGHYFLPGSEAPTSRILKFELTDYRHPPACETFTSSLAKRREALIMQTFRYGGYARANLPQEARKWLSNNFFTWAIHAC